MKAFVLSVEELLSGSLRLLPSNAGENNRDIVCRPVGPSWKRSYVAIASPSELKESSSGIFSTHGDRQAKLLPAHLIQKLKIQDSYTEILTATVNAIFSEKSPSYTSWGKFEAGAICSLCAKKREGFVLQYGEGYFHPPVTLKAENVSFSNILGDITILGVCDHHYKKNHGYRLNDLYI